MEDDRVRFSVDVVEVRGWCCGVAGQGWRGCVDVSRES